MLLMQRDVIKHVRRCLVGADPQRHFPTQVMQHDGILLAHTFKRQAHKTNPTLKRQAHKTNPTLPLPETKGWTNSDDGKLVPKLMTLACTRKLYRDDHL